MPSKTTLAIRKQVIMNLEWELSEGDGGICFQFEKGNVMKHCVKQSTEYVETTQKSYVDDLT